MELFKAGNRMFFVGIKGTGMSALAELLQGLQIAITGSDKAEVFYTDKLLKALGIPYFESFAAEHIHPGFDLVVYSDAYSPETNPELAKALELGIPIMKYTDALGAYSAGFDSSGITGVHGKTTVTALSGTLLRGAELPAQVLVGSAVTGFGGGSILNMGNRFFVAETDEYRRHFLAFHPKRIVLTSVESDHQDYYPTYQSIQTAFLEYINKLPPGGELIYCADDPGALETALWGAANAQKQGRDIRLIPYGFQAEGKFRILSWDIIGERQVFTFQGFPYREFQLRIPGRHSVLNAGAALALTDSLLRTALEIPGSEIGWKSETITAVQSALLDFQGSKRRSEIVGEAGGILFMDDYGHHPTAIRTTLAGLRSFYPNRRIVLSFMSHTYSRTAALLDDFANSLLEADILFLHKIYGSAREENPGEVTGETLYRKAKEMHNQVYYQEEFEDSLPLLKAILRSGDLFITMGAGDNWKLGAALFREYANSMGQKSEFTEETPGCLSNA